MWTSISSSINHPHLIWRPKRRSKLARRRRKWQRNVAAAEAAEAAKVAANMNQLVGATKGKRSLPQCGWRLECCHKKAATKAAAATTAANCTLYWGGRQKPVQLGHATCGSLAN